MINSQPLLAIFFVEKRMFSQRFVKPNYSIVKKNNEILFHYLNVCCTVNGVGYRGKMFYLSDLLFHVIGFG
ncbi:hypothetical protein C9I91_19920 [Photobacterium jeanii]|nr:hypothetical protein C9I91_19920 [Photobacterium jeanii]